MPRTLAFCKDVLDRNQREESKASTQLCVVQLGAFPDNKEHPPTNLPAGFCNRNPQARHLQLTKAGWTGKNKIRAGEGARMTWERPESPNFFCSSFYLIAFGESEILFVFHCARFRCTEDHRHDTPPVVSPCARDPHSGPPGFPGGKVTVGEAWTPPAPEFLKAVSGPRHAHSNAVSSNK